MTRLEPASLTEMLLSHKRPAAPSRDDANGRMP